MLDDACVEPSRLALDLLPVRIKSPVADALRSRYQTAHPGNTQASLPLRPHIAAPGCDLRIHQDGPGDRWGIRIAGIVALDTEDDHAERDADLGGG